MKIFIKKKFYKTLEIFRKFFQKLRTSNWGSLGNIAEISLIVKIGHVFAVKKYRNEIFIMKSIEKYNEPRICKQNTRE